MATPSHHDSSAVNTRKRGGSEDIGPIATRTRLSSRRRRQQMSAAETVDNTNDASNNRPADRVNDMAGTSNDQPADIVATRSDGTSVKLVCISCRDKPLKDCHTPEQFLRHLIVKHHYRPDKWDVLRCIEEKSKPISGEAEASTRSSGTGREDFAPHQAVQTKTEEAEATASSKPKRHNAVFEFRKDDDDDEPRIRTFTVCDTARKVFAQALVAGIASKETYLMNVQVDGGASIRIFAGDDEDWERVLDAVDGSAADSPVVVITSEQILGTDI